MAETIKCPHCECKVSLSEVEKEDGFCPECGQLVQASSLFDDFDDGLNEDMDGDDYDMEEIDDFDRDDNYDEDDIYDDDREPDILDELNANYDDDLDDNPKPKKRGGSTKKKKK